MVPKPPACHFPSLAQQLLHLHFAHPVGMAPGFDKNAEVMDALLAQGFSHVEVGTLTPRPQAGNPKPRLFRLPEDQAIINRMGFNNHGMEAALPRLKKRKAPGIVGVNIGKNKDTVAAEEDYLQLLQAVHPYADYITINISSPNTPGLRDLQARNALEKLLRVMITQRDVLSKRVPLLLKISPDGSQEEQEEIAGVCMDEKIDGLIISNTTIARPHTLQNIHRQESGGLSGKPLLVPSTEMLRNIYRLTKGTIPLIGVGGIASGADAYAKIKAGASLVQLYSALVYQGLGLVHAINAYLADALSRDGFSHISEAIGVEA